MCIVLKWIVYFFSSILHFLFYCYSLSVLLLTWLTGFSGVDGPEGHTGVSEHLWGALFPQQSGHDTLGLYIELCK